MAPERAEYLITTRFSRRLDEAITSAILAGEDTAEVQVSQTKAYVQEVLSIWEDKGYTCEAHQVKPQGAWQTYPVWSVTVTGI